jgi:hypothetical protein
VATARPSPYQGVAADVEHVRPREAAVSMLASALARTSSDAIEKLMGASPDSATSYSAARCRAARALPAEGGAIG